MIAILFLLLTLFSCEPPDSHPKYIEIASRDNGTSPFLRTPTYRVKLPLQCEIFFPDTNESIADTRKSLCEFFITGQTGPIRIAIHNFPTPALQDRIPPIAQVTRWKSQFETLDPITISLTPQAWGGFSGLLLEGQGTLSGKEATIMAWSMQLALEYHKNLSYLESGIYSQMNADFTIKATGSPSDIKMYRDKIVKLARSFELIHPLPRSHEL